MRKKGKAAKIKKIIIRVNAEEKTAAEELSKKSGMSTSEYIRNMLYEAKMIDRLSLHLKIVEKYEKILADLRALLKSAAGRRRG